MSSIQTVEHAGHNLSQVRNRSSGSRSATSNGDSSRICANGHRKKSNSSGLNRSAAARSDSKTKFSPGGASADCQVLPPSPDLIATSLLNTVPSFCKTSPLLSVFPPGNRTSHGDAPGSRRKRRFASATAEAQDAWKQKMVGAPSTFTLQSFFPLRLVWNDCPGHSQNPLTSFCQSMAPSN